MAKCNCLYCNDGRHKRHVNQHGYDGPEELPHRKKGGKPKKKRSDHKHLWETNGWQLVTYLSYNGRLGGYWKKVYECLECGKRGDVRYSYQEDKPSW